jgi:hypothetical protein
MLWICLGHFQWRDARHSEFSKKACVGNVISKYDSLKFVQRYYVTLVKTLCFLRIMTNWTSLGCLLDHTTHKYTLYVKLRFFFLFKRMICAINNIF